ncbi:hypothetical protein EMIT0P253_90114 [Pseudomonas sp. IT-P253]
MVMVGEQHVGDKNEGANYSIATGRAAVGTLGHVPYNARFFESRDDSFHGQEAIHRNPRLPDERVRQLAHGRSAGRTPGPGSHRSR